MSNWPEPSGAELQEWADQITDPLDDNGFVALTVDEEENIRAEFPRWGVTNYENRAFHRLLATLDAERATMATLRAELEAWRHPDVAPSTPLALELATLRAIEKAARAACDNAYRDRADPETMDALRAALGED